jgi:nicotinamide mononucleotide transporter
VNQNYKTHRQSDSSFRGILEWSAVVFNLLFTLLYLNQSAWTFVFGILGPLMLFVLSWREKLYAEPVLQLVYIASAVVGWINVQVGWKAWNIGTTGHLLLFALSTVIAVAWGWLLRRYTSANFPFLDACVASWGMLATWLMMYQVHVCWLYLIAVNVLSVFIYLRRELYAATFMFVLYLIMAVDGYFRFGWFEF